MSKTVPVAAHFVMSLSLLTVGACVLSEHPRAPQANAPFSLKQWDDVLVRPGVITHTEVVSARWHVPLSGVVDIDHPRSRAAGLREQDIDIVIPVHVLEHPEYGAFIIDTGVTAAPALFGAAAVFFGGMDVVAPTADILARHAPALAGVLLTHAHIDHVLGLPDVPRGTPVYVGPGELEARTAYHPLMASTYAALFDGHAAFRTWDFSSSASLAPFTSVIDVFGDGSLFALHTPGHTAGSTSYLALTTAGPRLFVGDNAHLWWGWENNVPPGTYSGDHEANTASLAALRRLVRDHPEIEVFVGHETDGLATGLNPYAVHPRQ